MTHPNFARFQTELTAQFTTLFADNPAYQRVKTTHTPEQLAAKMTKALADGGEKNSEGIQRTCLVLGLRHTYKAIRAFLAGAVEIPEPKKVTVPDKDGKPHTVECFATFDYEIDGRTFRFNVTRALDGLCKVVTHAKSGAKACNVGVGAAYLPAYAKLSSDEARAKLALDELIERHGADRVRCVIATAEDLPVPVVA